MEPHSAEWKDTNPKDAVGTRKVHILSVLPLRVLAGVANAFLEGSRKYGRHNYRVAGVRASVYIDAVGRHLLDFFEGQDIDADSGIHNIDKAISGLMVLRDSILEGNWVDDRPPAVKPGWIQQANDKAVEIIERTPNPKEAYTNKCNT